MPAPRELKLSVVARTEQNAKISITGAKPSDTIDARTSTGRATLETDQKDVWIVVRADDGKDLRAPFDVIATDRETGVSVWLKVAESHGD